MGSFFRTRRAFVDPARRKAETSIARNSAAQTGPVFVGYAASFLSAPVVLAGLGLRDFGIWALTGALAQYGSLLDLGLGRAMSRFIAVYDAQGNARAIGEMNVIGVLGSLALVAPLGALAVACAGPIGSAVGHISTGHMRVLLLCSVAMTVCAMLGRAIAAWPTGLRRMVMPNLAMTGGSLVNFVFSVGAIALGGHLMIYALANVAASVIAVIGVLGCVLATEGMPPLAWPRRGRIREVVAFSLKGQVIYLSDLVNYQTDKIIIALSVGPAAAGAYDIANRVCAAARSVGVFAQSALLPGFSATVARLGTASLRSVYAPLTRRCAAISFPGLLFCAASAPLLLSAWLGHIPPHGTGALLILPVAYLVNVSSGVSYAAAAAGNALQLPAWTSIGTALANLAITAALAPFFGVWGVLAGTFVAVSVGAAFQVALVQRHFKIAAAAHWNAVRAPLLLSAGLSLPVLAVSFPTASSTPRLVQLAILISLGAAYGLAYGVIASTRDLLPTAISRRIYRLVPGLRRAPA